MKRCNRCNIEKELNYFNKWSLNLCRDCKRIGYERRKESSRFCKTCVKKYQQGRPKQISELARKNRNKNLDRYRERERSYFLKNKENILLYQKDYYRKQRKTNPKFVINERMTAAVKSALKGNKAGRSWESLVGYTKDDLKARFESLFTEGMSWEKFLAGEIEIDHIIPKSHFQYENTDDSEFKACWAITNLQPLWKRDNRRKGDRLDYVI